MVEPITTLFLCGGEPALGLSAKRFVAALKGGKVALLLQDKSNLEKYLPGYLNPWNAEGLAGYDLIAPDKTGFIDENRAQQILRRASGVFVGGGNTAIYHQFYASGPIGDLIRNRCQQGMIYGGLSAGIVIAGNVCPLDPEETGKTDLSLEKGLGLFQNVLFEPHFTAQNRLMNLQDYLCKAGIKEGFGVDDTTCVVLRPGFEMEIIGAKVIPVKVSP
jgi:cyanophycinase